MSEHPAGLVTFEQDGAIGTITLRRPDKFNALDIPMLQALETALDDAEDADGVRVVLICGEGKGFCAGGDVEAWSHMSAGGLPDQMGALRASRVRPPCAAEAADDRRVVRPCAGRRAGTGGRGGFPGRGNAK